MVLPVCKKSNTTPAANARLIAQAPAMAALLRRYEALGDGTLKTFPQAELDREARVLFKELDG